MGLLGPLSREMSGSGQVAEGPSAAGLLGPLGRDQPTEQRSWPGL